MARVGSRHTTAAREGHAAAVPPVPAVEGQKADAVPLAAAVDAGGSSGASRQRSGGQSQVLRRQDISPPFARQRVWRARARCRAGGRGGRRVVWRLPERRRAGGARCWKDISTAVTDSNATINGLDPFVMCVVRIFHGVFAELAVSKIILVGFDCLQLVLPIFFGVLQLVKLLIQIKSSIHDFNTFFGCFSILT